MHVLDIGRGMHMLMCMYMYMYIRLYYLPHVLKCVSVTEYLYAHVHVLVCIFHSVFGIELPTTGRRMYVDPTTYARPEQAVQDFAMEIPPKSIKITEEIGNGEFGNVYCGIWKTEAKEQLPIAIKTLKVCVHVHVHTSSLLMQCSCIYCLYMYVTIHY